MSEEKYNLPRFLEGKVEKIKYKNWLAKKSRSVRRRDGNDYSNEVCKKAIHDAVCKSDGKDFYTNEKLDWHLISKWTSEKGATRDGFEMLPTVDHYNPRSDMLDFVICSWTMNGMKNDMTYEEFVKRCELVIKNKKT